MSGKAYLTNSELEITQKIQIHFPRGVISLEVLQAWNECPVTVLQEFLLTHFSQVPPEKLLEFIGTVTIPATTELFVVKQKFVVDTSASAPVKISFMSDNFKNLFLAGNGKVEEPIAEQTLRYQKLRKCSVDIPIITELSGESKAETTLTELYTLMTMQPNGEEGALPTNGYANIFYIRDIQGVLRSVRIFCFSDGWDLFAFPVDDPDGWLDGFLVFSRNS